MIIPVQGDDSNLQISTFGNDTTHFQHFKPAFAKWQALPLNPAETDTRICYHPTSGFPHYMSIQPKSSVLYKPKTAEVCTHYLCSGREKSLHPQSK